MNSYLITKERSDFIHEKFFEWSFDKPEDYLPSKKDFDKMTHPAELHLLAYIYNWDDDSVVLEWILDSPLCSRSTANLIFWKSLPSYFEESDFNDPTTCPRYCENGFSLIPKVLKRYEANDFSPIDIEFDPDEEIEEVDVSSGKWTVPPGVYDVIRGLTVNCE